ncbi:MAG: succinate CoA transferase [Rhodospirillales bacterium]
MPCPYPIVTAGEAAAMISPGQTVGFGGFTVSGVPKAISIALGERAAQSDFRIRGFCVTSGPTVETALAGALSFRCPYQANARARAMINSGEVEFLDVHLSHLTQALRYGFLGPMHWAIVEAADITPDGGIVLTSGVGAAPTFCAVAERILIELNRCQPAALCGMHDIYSPADPPHRREIPIYRPSDRIGETLLRVDPAKIAGVVEFEHEDDGVVFDPPSDITRRIGWNVAEFLAAELRAGRIPSGFLPVQSGVGDVANSVLEAIGDHPEIPAFEMYTEVVQDAVLRMMMAGRVRFASCCSLTVSREMRREVYGNLDWFRPRMVLRPQEITNHPEVVRRLGIISLNTALEADIFSNVNSTHVLGSHMMNGIGGSGDFTRNAYLSIFTCPSTAKAGRISCIVPMVTHTDHSEHSVQVIATEWGVADLRGQPPRKRAELIIENCAHPEYRDALRAYLRSAADGHTPHTLEEAFSFHQRYIRTGDMRLGLAAVQK